MQSSTHRLRFWAFSLTALILLCMGAAQAQPSEARVAQWTRFEGVFTSAAEYSNPVQDVQVDVTFTSPSGKTHEAMAFWDGGKIWKVRFSPAELGKWTYRTRGSNAADGGLHKSTTRRLLGVFECLNRVFA